MERNAQEKRRVKDGKPGCGKKWAREASKDGKARRAKKKCQSEVQKMREGQRGKEILKRSVKDGKVGGGKEIIPPEKHQRWKTRREKRNAEEKRKR